jgi:cytochrome c-type biogenesis protein CcmH/NrfF
MDNNLPLQVKKFNDKLRVMNSANAKILTLNAEEARGLQAEIYDLLVTIAGLSKNKNYDDTIIVNMDGGGFK